MKDKISALRALAEKYKKADADSNGLDHLRDQLQVEAKALLAHLSDLPAEVLLLPQSGGDHFPAATTQKLRSLSSVRTKLELLPGVKTKQQGQLDELRQQIRTSAKALLRHGRDMASAQMEALQSKLATEFLTTCGGDGDRAKAAAADVVGKSEAMNWKETFAFYNHASDPVEDAEAVVALAESFARGEPCD